MTLYLRYQADVWVEVDAEEDDVVNVVVDERTLASPVEAFDNRGLVASATSEAQAQRIADARCWPSWDYGPPPTWEHRAADPPEERRVR